VSPGPSSRQRLEALLGAALRAADAGAAVRRAIETGEAGESDAAGAGQGAGLRIGGVPVADGSPLVVLAAGKAAAAMAAALVERVGRRVARGLVVTKDGHGRVVPALVLRETAHPVPDERCAAAGREALALAATGRAHETLVVLLSGGASALLSCPVADLTLSDLAETTALLLASGADIHELNAVRKHVSAVAGGRLAGAWSGGPVIVLAVSDVPGDRLDVIGSGPCSADPSRFADAWRVVERRGLVQRLPAAVREHLRAGLGGERAENPGPGDPALARVHARIVASNALALAAAERAAREQGLRAAIDPAPLCGEARDAGPALLARARRAAAGGPLLWLAGGETTVRFEQAGRGGRSQELALAAALAMAGDPGIALLAAGTDGSDGPTDAAGAFADGGTVARGAARGLAAREALARHDSYTFFAAEGGLLRTGPTGTNVMDVAFVAVS